MPIGSRLSSSCRGPAIAVTTLGADGLTPPSIRPKTSRIGRPHRRFRATPIGLVHAQWWCSSQKYSDETPHPQLLELGKNLKFVGTRREGTPSQNDSQWVPSSLGDPAPSPAIFPQLRAEAGERQPQ